MLWVQLRKPVVIVVQVLMIVRSTACTRFQDTTLFAKCSPCCDVAAQAAADKPELNVLISVLRSLLVEEIA
jgi:hypothetical protein